MMARSVVAAEDANYCLHWGFDMGAIREALEDGAARGASTISQQTVKNTFLWQGRSWFRKALEALLTPVVELVWTKRRLLEVYLNVIEFDEGVFGVEAAAQSYFGGSSRGAGGTIRRTGDRPEQAAGRRRSRQTGARAASKGRGLCPRRLRRLPRASAGLFSRIIALRMTSSFRCFAGLCPKVEAVGLRSKTARQIAAGRRRSGADGRAGLRRRAARLRRVGRICPTSRFACLVQADFLALCIGVAP